MEKGNYFYREQECIELLKQIKNAYNAATPEKHPIIFKTREDYEAGMSILAICARRYPEVKIYAFQLMSNHVHFVTSGEKSETLDFFEHFKSRLGKHLPYTDLTEFKLKLNDIDSVEYFRYSVAYVNRNGFVVDDNVTPFSYPWGTSRCFFNPESRKYYEASRKPMSIREMRELSHSRVPNQNSPIMCTDGYASPYSFCHTEIAERIFRNARQYFYLVSKDVESYAKIAAILGEMVYYTDNDLYLVARNICSRSYGSEDFNLLPGKKKIELAKTLHYEYNAGIKQIARMLRIDEAVLKALFVHR